MSYLLKYMGYKIFMFAMFVVALGLAWEQMLFPLILTLVIRAVAGIMIKRQLRIYYTDLEVKIEKG